MKKYRVWSNIKQNNLYVHKNNWFLDTTHQPEYMDVFQWNRNVSHSQEAHFIQHTSARTRKQISCWAITANFIPASIKHLSNRNKLIPGSGILILIHYSFRQVERDQCYLYCILEICPSCRKIFQCASFEQCSLSQTIFFENFDIHKHVECGQ